MSGPPQIRAYYEVNVSSDLQESADMPPTDAPLLEHLTRLISDKWEFRRLLGFAQLRMLAMKGSVRYMEGKDLLHEAIMRTLDGRRTPNPAVSLSEHLMGCMRSIASEWSDKAGVLTDIRDDILVSTRADAELTARQTVERLRHLLRTEKLASDVLDALLEGYQPREIVSKLRINERAFWAAKKKLKRRLQDLVAD
jgi:RNA polymerase sigma-70 factor (ECF subfamily)